MKSSPETQPRDLFAKVRPTGWLGAVLARVSNPRKHRWNVYLRACRTIPASSPVHGSTDFKKINARRIALINDAHNTGAREPLESDLEFKALQNAAGAWVSGPMVASNFLLQRELHRLQRLTGST